MSNRIDKKELVSATLVQRHLVIPSSLPRTELRGNGAKRSGVEESRPLESERFLDSRAWGARSLGMTKKGGEKTA
jgi:hypothetical protein